MVYLITVADQCTGGASCPEWKQRESLPLPCRLTMYFTASLCRVSAIIRYRTMKEKYTSVSMSSRLIICIPFIPGLEGYATDCRYSYDSSLCIVAYCLFKRWQRRSMMSMPGICQKKWRMDWIGKSLDGERESFHLWDLWRYWQVTQSLLAAILAMALVSWLVIFSMIFHGQSWIP